MRPRFLVLSLVLAFTVGCGHGDLPRKIVHGAVTCGGQKVVKGSLRFTPIEPTSSLPSTSAIILDGQYRIEQWGGAPLGKYRVQIKARGATGRKIDDGMGNMVDEILPVGSPVYAGAQSPLVVEVTADSDAQIDIEIPK